MTGCWESACASRAPYFEAMCSLSLQGSRARARPAFWHVARELRYPSWAIQTAEVRCLGCPFHPEAPLKTSPGRQMCRGWKEGRGNRQQTGVCEHFQPPPSSGTWLWVARSTPHTRAQHLWILFCYGDSKYVFLQSWGIRVCPSFCLSALAWEGESPRGEGEPPCSPLCRSQVGDRCFCSGLAVPMSSLVQDIILVCSTTNLLWSIRRVVYLCSDKCYKH